MRCISVATGEPFVFSTPESAPNDILCINESFEPFLLNKDVKLLSRLSKTEQHFTPIMDSNCDIIYVYDIFNNNTIANAHINIAMNRCK